MKKMAVDKLFLRSHLQVLFRKLADGAEMDLARRARVPCDFMEIRRSLLLIMPVVEDAEPVWLEEVRDLAYDLEDIVDEITTLALIQDAKGIQRRNSSAVRKLIPTCSNFTPRALVSNRKLMSAIKDIRKKLNNISKQWRDLNLRNLGGLSTRSGVMTSESTSLFMESDVYGRDEDKKAIKEMLLRVESSSQNFAVIPIVGIAGIGKTTLAQLLYNDEDVKGNFRVRVWVHVSQEFDVLKITKKIYKSVTKTKGTGDMDLSMLQEDLREKLMKIKFFIVLDDVWNENHEKWNILCKPFEFVLPGSKIIVTTRNHAVASVARAAQSVYHIKLLTDEDCRCILAQQAQISFLENSHLQEVGLGLAKKCKGLPLVAKVLGGILRSEDNESEWKYVLSSKIWGSSKENDILDVLRLSYHNLPSHLRLPFAYCSVFPKDYEFDQNELVHLWMAEGFLDVPNGRKSKEDLGHKCFNELLSRSFFQRKSGRDSKFVMHDLISELAHFVSGGVCYCLDEKLDIDQDCQLPKKIRHASFLHHECEVFFYKFEDFQQVKGLRTFLPMPVQNSLASPPFHLSNRILVELVPRLHNLRTLSLNGYSITELPSSVCNLILLRHLNLSRTLILTLPPSVSGLFSLEFLSLSNCRFIHKLPSTLGDLSNLCHLDISDTDQLKDMPVEISRLIRLQTLPKIVLSGVGNLGLKELRWLKNLSGTFAIFELQNVANLGDATDAILCCKSEIEDLLLSWGSDTVNSEGICPEDVIERLQPHHNLRKLKIESYKGVNFPDWIGDPLYQKLSSLSLSNCTECTSLPPLGLLPELKHLHIGGMPRIKCIGIEFYGSGADVPFQRLETLRFEHMPEWEKWSARTEESLIHFPLLCQLTMFECNKLNDVAPMSLPCLHELDIEGCNIVMLKDKGKYWPKIDGRNKVHQPKN